MPAKTNTLNPEALAADIAKLRTELQERRDKLAVADQTIAAARHRAEQTWLRERAARFYATTRPAYDQAWQTAVETAVNGTGTQAVDAWFAWLDLSTAARAEHAALLAFAQDAGVPGMRPHLPGADSPRRTQMAAFLAHVEQLRAEKTRAAYIGRLRDEMAAAMDKAEQDARNGKPTTTTSLDPVAVFVCSTATNLKLNLGNEQQPAQFTNGITWLYSETEAEALRAIANQHGITEATEQWRTNGTVRVPAFPQTGDPRIASGWTSHGPQDEPPIPTVRAA